MDRNNSISPAGIGSSRQDSYISDLVKTVRDNLPEEGGNLYDREKLLNASRKLSVALETPGDTIQRVAYLVRASSLVYLHPKTKPSETINVNINMLS